MLTVRSACCLKLVNVFRKHSAIWHQTSTAPKMKICDVPRENFEVPLLSSCLNEESSTQMSKLYKTDSLTSITNCKTRNEKKQIKKIGQKKSNKNHQVKWDVSMEMTAEILQDMGVAALEEKSCDSMQDFEPTPPVTTSNCRLPPKIPRVNTTIAINGSGSPSFSGVADDFVLFRKCRSSGPLGQDQFSKLSDEIILHILKWLPKCVLAKCAQVCKRWKVLSYDETLWKRVDLGRKHLQPGVLGRVVNKGVVILRLAMSEVRCPIFVDFSTALKQENNHRFSKLQYLDLSMSSISPSSLSDLLAVCEQLKKLSLEHCAVTNEICRHISCNKDLEALNMTMCCGLTPVGLGAIATNCRRLKSWNLSWTLLNLDCLKVLSQFAPASLLKLNLGGCRHTLTDEYLAEIVQKCPNLVELDVSDATLLTSASIDAIVGGLSKLEHLHTSRCYNIPPAQYLQLSNLESLQHLDVFGVLTDIALQTLRHSLPTIEINRHLFSTVARPTTGIRRTSIWGMRVRD